MSSTASSMLSMAELNFLNVAVSISSSTDISVSVRLCFFSLFRFRRAGKTDIQCTQSINSYDPYRHANPCHDPPNLTNTTWITYLITRRDANNLVSQIILTIQGINGDMETVSAKKQMSHQSQ